MADPAVVGGRVEVDDAEALAEEVDAGDKRLALDAVLVQVGRVAVRGGDDDGAVVHERLDEAAQDHGVGDVGALELVEAQHRGLRGNVGGDKRDAVDVVAVLDLHLVQVAVHFLHEVVEVDALLVLDVRRERVVEQVHHHRLAGPDVAVHVDALGEGLGDVHHGLGGLRGAEEAAKEGGRFGLQRGD